jgi:ribonuclease BN (tRNA processing enzyme)
MEFTFLGTSAGTPTRSRNVTGLALCHSGPKPWGTWWTVAKDFDTYRLG